MFAYKELEGSVRNKILPVDHSKELWEKELWADIWEAVQKTNVLVFHVDAHSVPNSMEL